MISFTKEDLKNKKLIRFAIMFSTTGCCTATRRLRDNIWLIEFYGLSIVFTSIKVHLGLDLKHEISRISAKSLGPELILLHKNRCVCESKLYKEMSTIYLPRRLNVAIDAFCMKINEITVSHWLSHSYGRCLFKLIRGLSCLTKVILWRTHRIVPVRFCLTHFLYI